MSDLKIPILNNKSNKKFFKKKLPINRKSKSKLIKESIFMLFSSTFIIFLNYLIPNKILIFKNFFNNLGNLTANILASISYVYEILVALFVIVSLIVAIILVLGSFFRILKVGKRKTSRLTFK